MKSSSIRIETGKLESESIKCNISGQPSACRYAVDNLQIWGNYQTLYRLIRSRAREFALRLLMFLVESSYRGEFHFLWRALSGKWRARWLLFQMKTSACLHLMDKSECWARTCYIKHCSTKLKSSTP